MPKITPHLWFDQEAKEATAWYATIFPNSKIVSVNVIKDTPSGDCDIVSFQLCGQDFMAISAGPIFKINPSISFFVIFNNEKEITETWNKLSAGGKILMPFNTYPWAKKYGWLEDKFGMSWQLSFSDNHQFTQRITPLLMFTQDYAGQAKTAVEYYASIFPESKVLLMVPYAAGEGDKEGFIKHAMFSLGENTFMAMDSSGAHKFKFNEAISFMINCKDQEEIDYYWSKLSAVLESEQCGWVKDKFGVSWQIVPANMGELMAANSPEQAQNKQKVLFAMKKIDIEKLRQA